MPGADRRPTDRRPTDQGPEDRRPTDQRPEDRVLIVGAGVAGVAAARCLVERGVGAQVLEAAPDLGGVAGTFRIGDWRFDLGLHCFFTRLPAVRSTVDELMGDAHTWRPLREVVWWEGAWRPYPPLRNLARFPGGPWPVDEPADGPPEATDAAAAARAAVGDRLADLFVLPYLRRYWGRDPASLPPTAARAALAPPAEVAAGARTALDDPPSRAWAYPVAGGFASYVRRLAAGVPVRFGARVTKIDPSRREVTIAGTEVVPYDQLITSVPLPELASIVAALPGRLAKAAGALPHSSVTLVSLGVTAASPPAPWVYATDSEVPWFRAAFPAELDAAAAPAGTASVQTETYWYGRPPKLAPFHVVASLRRLGLLPPHARVLATDLRVIRYASTCGGAGDRAAVDDLIDWLGHRGIHCVGRYGRWDNAKFDQALHGAHRLAEELCGTGLATTGNR